MVKHKFDVFGASVQVKRPGFFSGFSFSLNSYVSCFFSISIFDLSPRGYNTFRPVGGVSFLARQRLANIQGVTNSPTYPCSLNTLPHGVVAWPCGGDRK